MKVILKEDVFKLGSLGDEVDVKPGFARNYLIPQGKALPLTRENVKQIVHQRSLLAKKRADAIEQAQAMAGKLAETEVEFIMKSGESGKLFGSVTQKHIYDALIEKGIEIERKQLHLSSPIKTLGSHKIAIKLHTEVNGELTVKIIAEVEEKPAEDSQAEGSEQSSPETAEQNIEESEEQKAE